MVYPHQPTLLPALDLPLISSHEPTCHWSPDESEDRMMCNFLAVVKETKQQSCIYTYINYFALRSFCDTVQYSLFSITTFMYI